MKNKRIFLVGICLTACLFFIMTVCSGCCYALGRNIGNQVKDEITKNSDLIFNETDTTPESSETTESDNSIVENDSTTDQSSTINDTVDNNQNTNVSENEIQVSFGMDYIFNISGDVSNLRFIVIIPKEYEDRQRIINAQYSIKPERIFNDGTNTYAEFRIENPSPSFEINIMDEIILSQYGLKTASNADNKEFDIGNLNSYIKAEKYIESDDEDIKKIAETFEGEDTYALVEVIYNYVMDNIEYSQYVPEDVGAKTALIEKQGDCTSYSDLFIALLRERGIPARMTEGYTINATDLNIGHNWVEVYFNDIGWAPFDPTFDDNNGSTSLFNNLDNLYVYFSLKRNDSVLKGFHYFAYNWHGNGKVEVTKNISTN